MEVTVDPPEIRFRTDVRRWLEDNATPTSGDDGAGFIVDPEMVAAAKEFQAKLYDAGLAGLSVPREYGGRGLTKDEQLVFAQEASRFAFPTAGLPVGLGMCVHALLEAGTEAQKLRHVPRILRGMEVWCLLFSEPGAGSDLASLQSRAVHDGAHWVLNGQKVWTSNAQLADYGLLLARTDASAPKHAGISMFVLDMRSKGVMVRPLRQMTGSAEFNEVFFDDVLIQEGNLIGELNEGWQTAVLVLSAERDVITRRRATLGTFESLVDLVHDRRVANDSVIRQRLAGIWIQERVLDWMTDAFEHAPDRGVLESLGKLAQVRLSKDAASLALAVTGIGGAAWEASDREAGRWSRLMTGVPAWSIAGGTDEIQRTLVGERVLGLPREL